jgi:hypothetical protein
VVIVDAGRPVAVLAFTIAADRIVRIVRIDTITDPDRVAELAGAAPPR